MTCIIGLVEDGRVYIGADSAAANQFELRQTALKKVFRRSTGGQELIIGYTDSFRMGQILQYHLMLEKQPDDEDDLTYLVRGVADQARATFRERGYLQVENEQEAGGTFLIGYRGKLYIVESDFQVNHYLDDFEAIGSGREYALGAMLALKELSPRERIGQALEIAAHFSVGVIGPFFIEEL